MSAELNQLRHRIRTRKAELRREIKQMREWNRKTRKHILRYGQACDKVTIRFARDNSARLGRRRAALEALVELTRK